MLLQLHIRHILLEELSLQLLDNRPELCIAELLRVAADVLDNTSTSLPEQQRVA